ncbi:uncharacterized protein LOC105386820 isoform X3 [Plutella xylostella]|uniref:uncharacterized protein LOC105386820 isoform X3 n=1 Tax=Plutella xylostella TaxID=51655 RepID=UPI00203237D3|nr:uncharacterized protein LOC105386820 isoform X3 [Plutella xylostella]
MPDTLSLTTGVSLGLLAGIVSGVCYIFANGLNKPRQSPRPCLPAADKGVCTRCGGDQVGDFLPCVCVVHEPVKFEQGAWFLRQVRRAASLMPWSCSSDRLEQIDEECEGADGPERRGDLRNVREFLEALSAKLAGGPLEGTRVTPIYNHPAYLPRVQSSGDSAAHDGASSAHAQLKRLVSRVVDEAAALPALARYAVHAPPAPSVDATYEDLLATAILNKVIERYQAETGSGGRSSGIHSASASPTPSERSSPRSLISRHRDVTPPLNESDELGASDWEGVEEALELPRRVPFPEFGGDIIHGTGIEDRDFDEVSGSDIQAVDGSWEENWLFQKKKIKTLHSVPVPMLVPNSNTDYKALIGDRDADDTTDLSDNASDADEDDSAYQSDIKRVLDSKHVIGGKSKVDEVDDFEPDSLTNLDDANDYEEQEITYAMNDEVDGGNGPKVDTINQNVVTNAENDTKDSIIMCGIDSGPLQKAEFSVKEEIHRTLLNGIHNVIDEMNDDTQNDNELDIVKNDDYQQNREFTQNTLNGHEREGEYEETVTVPVQRYADSLRRRHFDDYPQTIPTRDTDKDDLIPGSIADRERKKWLNYVEMPNNPYSPEAIQRRLSSKSTSSIFDMITRSKEYDDSIDLTKTKDTVEIKEHISKEEEVFAEKEGISEETEKELNCIKQNGAVSPTPRILKDVLAEEVPQYKRYGRDYYIREAKSSCGGRKKKSFSDISSFPSMQKATSLDNFDTEFASTVSASSSLSDLEASALHHNISRAVLSPRNASPNFAINPIFEHPDRTDENVEQTKINNGLLIQQFNKIATNEQYTDFADRNQPHQSITIITDSNNSHDILIEYDDVNATSLFSAKPAIVDDDTDKKFQEILETAYNCTSSDKTDDEIKSPTSLLDQSFLSTSSVEDSIKIYNVQTGEIVKCKPVDNVSEIYDEKVDSNDNIDIPDKNEMGIADAQDISLTEEGDEIAFMSDENSITHNKLSVIDEFEEIALPKVKELAKKFVSMDTLNDEVKPPVQNIKRRKSKDSVLDKPQSKLQYMHSLTARSISREFREELKLSMATPLKTPGGSNDAPDGEIMKESSRPGSPLPEPGTLKTKLAFFESLKSKFNTK